MKEPSKTAVTAAWITGLLGCVGVTIAAIIGLGLPVVQRLVEPTPTPVVIVVTATPPQPVTGGATLDTPTSPPIRLTNTPVPPTDTSTPESLTLMPTSTPIATPVPPKPPVDKYHIISLRDWGTAEDGNLQLRAGIRTLENIDFEIGWLVTTQSQDHPDYPQAISLNVQQDIPSPAKVHFLLQAGQGLGQSKEFGSINIVFADGSTLKESLVLGYNIRDWSQVNNPLAAPNAQQAWEGVGWDGSTKGVVDILTISIPSDYRQSQIVKIEVRDESVEKLNSLNPTIHLWAVTVE